MAYKTSSIDLIRDVVQAMTFPIKILSVTSVAGVHTVKACDIYHAQPGFSVIIGGKSYIIKDISGSDTLILLGADAITADSFDLYTPFYFHGTPIQQGMELAQQTQAFNKTPMVWFYEQFTDNFHNNNVEKVERDITMRLFFLTQANTDKWLTDDAYHNAIDPMRRLAENFIEQLSVPVDNNRRFNTIDFDFQIKNYHKFGVFLTDRGMEKSLWAEKLAGCELSMDLSVFRYHKCETC